MQESTIAWTQFIIFFVGVFGLFIWNRTESRADVRHLDNKLDAIRELAHAIHLESKEFHNRLCDIERGRK